MILGGHFSTVTQWTLQSIDHLRFLTAHYWSFLVQFYWILVQLYLSDDLLLQKETVCNLGYLPTVATQIIDQGKSERISESFIPRVKSMINGWLCCSDGNGGPPCPRERSTVESFLSAVRLAVNFVCIASQGQEDTGKWIIDFHLPLIGEQVCSLFPSNSFHLHGDKYKHSFNLSLVVSTFAINCVFKNN